MIFILGRKSSSLSSTASSFQFQYGGTIGQCNNPCQDIISLTKEKGILLRARASFWKANMGKIVWVLNIFEHGFPRRAFFGRLHKKPIYLYSEDFSQMIGRDLGHQSLSVRGQWQRTRAMPIISGLMNLLLGLILTGRNNGTSFFLLFWAMGFPSVCPRLQRGSHKNNHFSSSICVQCQEILTSIQTEGVRFKLYFRQMEVFMVC